MRESKYGIDGFWLFLIGVFVVLPAIEYFYGEEDNVDAAKTIIDAVSGKGDILEIDKDTASAAINTEVRIPIHNNTVIVKKVSPDEGKPEVIIIKGKYAITSFNQTGSWDINMYDVNNLLVGWVKITVY